MTERGEDFALAGLSMDSALDMLVTAFEITGWMDREARLVHHGAKLDAMFNDLQTRLLLLWALERLYSIKSESAGIKK